MFSAYRYYSFILIAFLLSIYSYGNTTKNYMITVEGIITDMKGNSIENVSVYSDKDSRYSTTTNNEGYFKFILPEGKHTLVFYHTAYNVFKKEIYIDNKQSTQTLNISLEEKVIAMEEVIIDNYFSSVTLSIEKIKRNHRQIAGGTSVAVMNPEVQRLETLKDALQFEPGVVIQEFFGANDQPRISIRGSGIQSNPQRRGIYFLQDGVPVNFADGSFITGVMDPSVAESVEVFKGANALKFGAATLGGAINFNSRTGRHTQGISLKTESGSFAYTSLAVLAGKQWNDTDAHISVSGSMQDGFRAHNQSKKLSVTANLGHRFSNAIDNRTYFNYSYIDFDIPGPLPLATLLKDPTQINQGINLPYTMGPNILRDKPKREAMVMRVANRTAFRINHSVEATLGIYYQNVKDRFVFPIVISTQRSNGHDFGANFNITKTVGKHNFSAGLASSYGIIDRRGHINKNGLDSYMFSDNRFRALNMTLYTEAHFKPTEKLHLIANLQLAYNERNSKDHFPNPELRPWYSHSSHKYRYFYSEDTSLKQNYKAVNPRIGAIYDLGKENPLQIFANVSGSYEPPTFDELVGTAVTENINTSPKKLYAVKLDKQSAVTAEFGSRYESKRLGWNISLYQSWLKNELLEVKDFVLGVKETKNYPNTIHRGIEAGIMYVPIEGIFSRDKKDRVLLKTMYTYSDFYFSSGAYKNNRIAGLPPHYVSGALEYQYPGKFFLSFGIESQPEKSYVDHQNTLSQPAYTIYGFRIGFEQWKNISFYIEGKNIFNKHYAASYVVSDEIHLPAIPFPNFTVNNIAFFVPGQTQAFYVGLSYKI